MNKEACYVLFSLELSRFLIETNVLDLDVEELRSIYASNINYWHKGSFAGKYYEELQ